MLGPEDTKIKMRKNTDLPTKSGTTVSVSQDWKIQRENRYKINDNEHKTVQSDSVNRGKTKRGIVYFDICCFWAVRLSEIRSLKFIWEGKVLRQVVKD